jgi:hypothetical protein
MNEEITNDGGCLCGAVRYRVNAQPSASTLCHCSSCRRASGAPSLAWAVFRVGELHWLHGVPAYFASSPGVTRGFCARCGTALTYRRDSRSEFIDVTAASFDHPECFAPSCEIWVEHRLPWMVANPALPQHARSSKPKAANAI